MGTIQKVQQAGPSPGGRLGGRSGPSCPARRHSSRGRGHCLVCPVRGQGLWPRWAPSRAGCQVVTSKGAGRGRRALGRRHPTCEGAPLYAGKSGPAKRRATGGATEPLTGVRGGGSSAPYTSVCRVTTSGHCGWGASLLFSGSGSDSGVRAPGPSTVHEKMLGQPDGLHSGCVHCPGPHGCGEAWG